MAAESDWGWITGSPCWRRTGQGKSERHAVRRRVHAPPCTSADTSGRGGRSFTAAVTRSRTARYLSPHLAGTVRRLTSHSGDATQTQAARMHACRHPQSPSSHGRAHSTGNMHVPGHAHAGKHAAAHGPHADGVPRHETESQSSHALGDSAATTVPPLPKNKPTSCTSDRRRESAPQGRQCRRGQPRERAAGAQLPSTPLTHTLQPRASSPTGALGTAGHHSRSPLPCCAPNNLS
jgi:hypothetical protein